MMTNSKKSICFIAGTLGQGGAERQLYYYVRSLLEKGYRPYVLCLTAGDFWEGPIRKLGVPVIWVGRSNSHLFRLFSIMRQILQKPTDIIHSQHFHTNIYAFLAAVILQKKMIGALRSDVFSEISSAGLFGKLCFKLPVMLAANSKSAIANAVSLGKPINQLYYLPNVVDEVFFSPGIPRTIRGKLQVLFIGTLWPPKRVDRVVQIAKKSLEQKLDIIFKVYGNGVQRIDLHNQAKQSGVLNRNLYFMGPIADARKAYQEADVFLLTSDHEGTPNVVLEAMSCGLPVISTNVGDVPDLIKNGINGFIGDLDNNAALFENLKELYYDPLLRSAMGQKNREKIVNERSLKNLDDILAKLYDQRG